MDFLLKLFTVAPRGVALLLCGAFIAPFFKQMQDQMAASGFELSWGRAGGAFRAIHGLATGVPVVFDYLEDEEIALGLRELLPSIFAEFGFAVQEADYVALLPYIADRFDLRV